MASLDIVAVPSPPKKSRRNLEKPPRTFDSEIDPPSFGETKRTPKTQLCNIPLIRRPKKNFHFFENIFTRFDFSSVFTNRTGASRTKTTMIALAENIESEDFSDEDIRRMLRLFGGMAILPPAHPIRKRHLLSALCEVIRADSWIWSLCGADHGNGSACCVTFELGNGSQEPIPASSGTTEHEVISLLKESIGRKFFTAGKKADAGDEESDSEDANYQRVNSVAGTKHLGSALLSFCGLEGRLVSGIALYRRKSLPPFSAREARIAQVVLSEAPWVHEAVGPRDRSKNGRKLFPRQKLVLDLLLQGHGRKSISQSLRISENTVSGYVKDIYKHYQVNSHAGLIRRFHFSEGVAGASR